MGVVPFLPSAVLFALVSPEQEASAKAAGPAKQFTGNRAMEADSGSGEVATFLQMNPEEEFDLEAINAVDPQALLEEAQGDKRVLREIIRKAEALLPRIRAETEDPLLVGAILRNKTLEWYRRSPSDENWVHAKVIRWGGIFYESRIPGGRLSRKLSTRMVTLINHCVKAAGAGAFLRAGVSGLFRGSKNMASIVQFALGSKRPRLTQQVAQAYLDDLAAASRYEDQALPLEHLSGLSRRNSTPEVNMTLVELFPQDGTGTITVLDPRFHPGMNALIIRVVPPKNVEDGATYDLIQTSPHSAQGSKGTDVMTTEDAGSPWERTDMMKKEWLALMKTLEKRRARMEPPPRENSRERESYLGLRDLLLSDTSMRRAFLIVHWKGKPSGLALLCELLAAGKWTPDVETDGDYLEAELDHLDKAHADRGSKNGQWKIGHGWTVVREVGDGNVRTYRASGKSED